MCNSPESVVLQDFSPPGPTGAAGPPGADGDPGANGADGDPGAVWRNGSGVPSSGLGINGDYYLDDDTGDLYEKAAGAYSVVANINGTDGVDGGMAVIDPARTDAVLVCADGTGATARATGLTIYSSANDKLEYLASFGEFETAADGATVTFDFDVADQWQVILGGNRTLAFANASVGQRVLILLTQDGTGNRTPTWWSNIEWNHGLAPVIDPAAGGWNLIVLECVGLGEYSVPLWTEVSRTTSAPRRGITTATDGATVTFDLRVSPKQKVTLAGSRTLALNSASYYVGQVFALKITQDGTGSRTVTWWSGIKWPDGTVPTLTTTLNRSDWFLFVCTDASGSPTFDCLGMSLNLGA